jgi:centractin
MNTNWNPLLSMSNQPVVIDNGSGYIKAGFAGEDLPKTYFPSIIGTPKHTKVMAGAVQGDTFIGTKAQDLRGILKITYPSSNGIVTNWADMEKIWQFVFSDLNTQSENVFYVNVASGFVDRSSY